MIPAAINVWVVDEFGLAGEQGVRDLGISLIQAVPACGLELRQMNVRWPASRPACELETPRSAALYNSVSGERLDTANLLNVEQADPDTQLLRHLTVQIIEYRPYVPQRLVVQLELLDALSGSRIGVNTIRWTGQDIPSLSRGERRVRWRRGLPAMQPGDELARVSTQEFWRRAARDIASWTAETDMAGPALPTVVGDIGQAANAAEFPSVPAGQPLQNAPAPLSEPIPLALPAPGP